MFIFIYSESILYLFFAAVHLLLSKTVYGICIGK